MKNVHDITPRTARERRVLADGLIELALRRDMINARREELGLAPIDFNAPDVEVE